MWVRTIGCIQEHKSLDPEYISGWNRNRCYISLSSAVSVHICNTLSDLQGLTGNWTESPKAVFDVACKVHECLCAHNETCTCMCQLLPKDYEKWYAGETKGCTMFPVDVYDTTDVIECAVHTQYAPYYFVAVKPNAADNKDGYKILWHLIHPDEREHMERILAGTDNPIYDLVHELRYNPRVGIADVAEAKADFESKKRKLE